MNNKKIRVRFAPSPTGHLHLGGVRTALYNWLFARQNNGVFVLRIEDTDRARSTEKDCANIIDDLQWLGMDWDEGPQTGGEFGPYFQSQRGDMYKDFAHKLLEKGLAYYCYCEILAFDKEKKKEGKMLKEKIRCSCFNPEVAEKYKKEGRKKAIRFKVKEGTTEFDDLVRGKISFQNETLEDFIIMRSDGMPTYNFAVVVDDALMKISHIIRGDDHISNTPKQILLYKALEFDLPTFAHISMILGYDGKRLSKRHGATSIGQYHDDGFLPEAMINYLVRLGWGYDDKQELFTKDELIQKFSIEKVSKTSAVFNPEKLIWMNGVYIKDLSLEEKTDKIIPLLRKKGFIGESQTEEEKEWIREIVKAIGDRFKKLADIFDYADFFFTEEVKYDNQTVQKLWSKAYTADVFLKIMGKFEKLDVFNLEEIASVFESISFEMELKLRHIAQPIRFALTGKTVTPGIYEVIHLLGKQKTINRLKKALEICQNIEK